MNHVDWDRVDTAELVKCYCAASTASALCARLSTQANAMATFARCSTEELMTKLRGLLAQPVCIDRNARAYAVLVALALYSPQTVRKAVLEGDIDALRWAQAIVNAADAQRAEHG
jgi:hypothetical protein